MFYFLTRVICLPRNLKEHRWLVFLQILNNLKKILPILRWLTMRKHGNTFQNNINVFFFFSLYHAFIPFPLTLPLTLILPLILSPTLPSLSLTILVHFAGGIFYPYLTCALDSEQCQKVFNVIQDTLFKEAIEAAQFK